ncbi:hypothetical protein GEMRC1_013315 [Eukaryota sp. GEM-RC1]
MKRFSIQKLTLNRCYLSTNVITVLCELIQISDSLTSIDFSYNQMSDSSFLDVLSELQSNFTLKRVVFNNVDMKLNSVLTIFELISTTKLMSNIQISPHSIDISRCSIRYANEVENQDLRSFLMALQSNLPIKRVECRGIRSLNLEGLITLFQIRTINKSILNLNISPHFINLNAGSIRFQGFIYDADVFSLLKALQSNVSIQTVKCNGLKEITLKGLIALFEILSINKSMIDFDLFPHCVDVDHGLFCFSPKSITQVSIEDLSLLRSLLIALQSKNSFFYDVVLMRKQSLLCVISLKSIRSR